PGPPLRPERSLSGRLGKVSARLLLVGYSGWYGWAVSEASPLPRAIAYLCRPGGRTMRRLTWLVGATASLALLLAGPAGAVSPGGTQQLRFAGTFTLGGQGAGTASSGQVPPHEPNGKQLRHVQAAGVPTVTPTGVSATQLAGFAGFNGLSHFDQATAGTGIYAGTQFELEPPDQALCVGNGHVVEGVNNAVQVFSTAGAAQTAPIAL